MRQKILKIILLSLAAGAILTGIFALPRYPTSEAYSNHRGWPYAFYTEGYLNTADCGQTHYQSTNLIPNELCIGQLGLGRAVPSQISYHFLALNILLCSVYSALAITPLLLVKNRLANNLIILVFLTLTGLLLVLAFTGNAPILYKLNQ